MLLPGLLDLHALPTLQPAHKGYVAELYVQYYLARRGVKYANPSFPTEGEDLIVFGPSGKPYRCEVKAKVTGTSVDINRMRYVSGKMVQKPYSNVDFFILVTLQYEHVFVYPGEKYLGKRQQVGCYPGGSGWLYKDRVDLFI